MNSRSCHLSQNSKLKTQNVSVAMQLVDQSRFRKIGRIGHADGEGAYFARFQVFGDDELFFDRVGTRLSFFVGFEKISESRRLVDLAAAQFSRFDGVVDQLDRQSALSDFEFSHILDTPFENDLFGSEDSVVFDREEFPFFRVFVQDEHAEYGGRDGDEKGSENHRPEDVAPRLFFRNDHEQYEEGKKEKENQPVDNGQVDHG
jgi:hypothetical protein